MKTRKTKPAQLKTPECKVCGGEKEDLRGTGDYRCCAEYVGDGISSFNETVRHMVKGKFGFEVGG